MLYSGDDYTGRPSTSAAVDGAADMKKDGLTGHSKTAQKILALQKQPAGPTLFLGNLGFGTTEQSIREMLENHRVKPAAATHDNEDQKIGEEIKKSTNGWIRKIRMGTFEDSGKCKGCDLSSVSRTLR